MGLTRPNLSIENTVNDECTAFSIADTTTYGGAPSIGVNSVTGLVINVVNESTGIYFTYTFVIVSGVIQTGTLSIQGGTPASITTYVVSLAWPFITAVNEFNLFGSYGVTLPDFGDAAFQVEYTITGRADPGDGSGPADFSYTTSETFLVDCETACCISKMLADLDPNCSCSDTKQALAISAYTWLLVARASANYGQVDKAVAALQKASDLCNCDCGC